MVRPFLVEEFYMTSFFRIGILRYFTGGTGINEFHAQKLRAERGMGYVVKRTLWPSSLLQYSHWCSDLFTFGEPKDRVYVSDRRGFVIISLFLFRGGGQEIYNCTRGGVVRKNTAFFPFFFPPLPTVGHSGKPSSAFKKAGDFCS